MNRAEAVNGETPTTPDDARYVGLITRGIAFALDAAVINLIALVVAVGAALIVSIFHFGSDLKTVIAVVGAVAYILWSIGYFAGFWSTTGQTPGCRAMQCRVVTADGRGLGLRRALVRCVGVVLAALPLFAGFLLIPFDRRRRGFQDRFAATLVIEAPALSSAEHRQLERSAARRAAQPAGASLDSGQSSDPGEEASAVRRQAGNRPRTATP